MYPPSGSRRFLPRSNDVVNSPEATLRHRPSLWAVSRGVQLLNVPGSTAIPRTAVRCSCTWPVASASEVCTPELLATSSRTGPGIRVGLMTSTSGRISWPSGATGGTGGTGAATGLGSPAAVADPGLAGAGAGAGAGVSGRRVVGGVRPPCAAAGRVTLDAVVRPGSARRTGVPARAGGAVERPWKASPTKAPACSGPTTAAVDAAPVRASTAVARTRGQDRCPRTRRCTMVTRDTFDGDRTVPATESSQHHRTCTRSRGTSAGRMRCICAAAVRAWPTTPCSRAGRSTTRSPSPQPCPSAAWAGPTGCAPASTATP